jgi:SAM-dependent methyltransferase
MPLPRVSYEQSHEAAFNTYRDRLRDLIAQRPGARILELGAGRDPSFSLADLPDTVASYTINDIDPAELALVPDGYQTACFDVIGDVSEFANRYDLIFSRTLIEHVRDGRAMHRNVLSLLRPGGAAFHFAPTLYAPPFILNRLLPEKLSRSVLLSLFPERRNDDPKFPAHYSWCFGSRPKMERMLKTVGFRDVSIQTFWGYDYFRAFPGLRELDRALNALAAKWDVSALGSFAHILAVK